MSDRLRFHPLFSKGAVLQREQTLTIWGWAKPGSEIQVSLAGANITVESDANGRFQLAFPPMPTGGPFTLLATTGSSVVAISDIYIGEVWICSGQSNMEWNVGQSADARYEIENANHPLIRLFHVPHLATMEAKETVHGHWATCSPETVSNFSAVGYYFAREVRSCLPEVPIGLIHSSWGGSIAEAWTPRETLLKEPLLREFTEGHLREAGDPAAQENWLTLRKAWEESLKPNPEDRGWALGWAGHEVEKSEWDTIQVPGSWQSRGWDFSGVLWFRKEVILPESWQGRDLEIRLGACDKSDITWFNNERIGGLSLEDRPDSWSVSRSYRVPGRLVRQGLNIIAVRIFSHIYAGGFVSSATDMTLTLADTSASPRISLSGNWAFRVEHSFGKIGEPPPQPAGEGSLHTAAALYNGMIAPLVPYTFRGVLWYQGESNTTRAGEYTTLMKCLIRSWRNAWQQGDFPFLIVQLANHRPTAEEPLNSAWAELREAQRQILDEPGTYMAVTIDLGEAGDIHPRNKQDVGRRLARVAMARVHGLPVPWSGPILRDGKSNGPFIYISFSHATDGLRTTDNGPVQGFAVAGPDRQFRRAKARIENDTVVVSHPQIPNPKFVRYAWADDPACNLCNQDGLPAGPFAYEE